MGYQTIKYHGMFVVCLFVCFLSCVLLVFAFLCFLCFAFGGGGWVEFRKDDRDSLTSFLIQAKELFCVNSYFKPNS